MRLSARDFSTVEIDFAREILKYDSCYNLVIEQYSLTTRLEGNEKLKGMHICTTKCEGCNLKGSNGCNEDTGKCNC
jgi:hypothetical protein